MNHDQDHDMSDDHLAMQEIMEDHGINMKQLASETGVAQSTLYKYAAGIRTIASVVWRTLYRLTGDQRIIKLITGEVAVAVVPTPTVELMAGPVTCQRLIEERQKHIECEAVMLGIIADGKVDGHDRKAVEKYKRIFPEMIALAYQTYHAITQQYQRATGRKEATHAR